MNILVAYADKLAREAEKQERARHYDQARALYASANYALELALETQQQDNDDLAAIQVALS